MWNITNAQRTGLNITRQPFDLVCFKENIIAIVIEVRSLKTCNISNWTCRIVTNRSENLFTHNISWIEESSQLPFKRAFKYGLCSRL